MSKGLAYSIVKSFGTLSLIPKSNGLQLIYAPNQESEDSGTPLDLLIPIDYVGSLWATSRAFLYNLESLDENIILQGLGNDKTDILIKLYRDKPKGDHGKLSGDENCWLRLVTGRNEEERRRIKLGPRDLICLELACNSVVILSNNK